MQVWGCKQRDASNGGMQVELGKWRDCKWRVASGGLQVEVASGGCKWRDASGGMQVEGCK